MKPTTTADPFSASINSADLARKRALWLAWRRGRSEKLAAAIWPMLQRIGEANKAGLVVEFGALDGELAIALSRRFAWRDLFAVDPDADLLAAGAKAAYGDPALHRLDFCRSLGSNDASAPRFPFWRETVSGAVMIGALGLSANPAATLEEALRAVRPGASVLLAEPVGAWLGDGAKIPAELRRAAGWLSGLAKGNADLELIGEERAMGLVFSLGRKRGVEAPPEPEEADNEGEE